MFNGSDGNLKPIVRSRGYTKSERYLSELCDRSFMNLWSYPNLYVDKGRTQDNQEGKELCDVFVLCGNIAFIFSDKDISFSTDKEMGVAWPRWCRRAVFSALKQVKGAERVILNTPESIYLDKKCTKKFPLNIPNSDDISIHRIIVATGSNDACKKHFRKFGTEENGNLMINPGLKGKAHLDKEMASHMPFAIGDINSEGEFVHVLDEFTLDLVMRELDTVSDLSDYFAKRADLIRNGTLGPVNGEEELLAVYLRGMNEEGEHDFVIDGQNLRKQKEYYVYIEPGLWDELQENPMYIAKKQADKTSYVWDSLINSFSTNVLNGTSIAAQGVEAADIENSIRIMALENRLQRRFLALALVDAVEASPGKHVRYMRSVISGANQTPYIFLFYPALPLGVSPEDHRAARSECLAAYCLCFMEKYHEQHEYVLGIATDYPDNASGKYSEDMILCQPGEWTVELQNLADEGRLLHGIMDESRLNYRRIRVREYPESDAKEEPGTVVRRSPADAKSTGRTDQRRKKRAKRRMLAKERRKRKKR